MIIMITNDDHDCHDQYDHYDSDHRTSPDNMHNVHMQKAKL